MKKLSVPDTYKTLVAKISKELSELEFFIKRRTAEGYWNIGRYIHEHLLEYKDRADYGTTVIEKLAKDVDRDRSTLQRSLQFYRAYPIRADQHKLSWDHYKRLITIKDEKERKRIEAMAVRKDWSTTKLGEYLFTKRELTQSDNGDKPIPQLSFTRGKLHTYQIVKANKPLAGKSPLVLDLGFRQEYVIPKNASQFKEGDLAELGFNARKVTVSKDELFTYKATIDKIIDGDTLLVSFDFNLDVSISQKLRLRGIDCPEIDTDEGKKAKRFVESRLKSCEFIIVKTYKDRSDKFDRYLADIFYRPDAAAPEVVAKEGFYLNQELLNEHLALGYE